jgi:hypothetical protein
MNRIQTVEAIGNFRLNVSFEDGSSGVVDLVVLARNTWIIQSGGEHHVAGVWGHGSAPRGVTARTGIACAGARGALPRWKCASPTLL